MNRMRSALLSWLGRLRPAAFWIGVAANIIAIGGFLGLVWKDWVEPRIFPWVTIACPSAPIHSHQHMFFGRYSTPAWKWKRVGYQVRLYVHPEDGDQRYELMPRKLELPPERGIWADWARCGNLGGVDMKVPPPIDCTVFAVLVEARAAGKLPGSDPSQPWIEAVDYTEFVQFLQEEGVTAVSARCRILRLPEASCTEPPRILSPGHTATSPVELRWEPNTPMYVELWKHGRREVGQFSKNGDKLPLTPGTWQLKVAPGRDFECLADVWFNVQG